MNRVLMNFTIAVLTGILLPQNRFVYMILIGILFLAYLLVFLKTKRHFVLVWILGIAVGIFTAQMAPKVTDRPLYPYLEQKVEATVEVASVPVVAGEYVKFQGIIHSANGISMQEKAIIYVYGEANIKVNQLLTIDSLKIKLAKNQRNFNSFDYRRYLTGKGIYFTANAQSKEISNVQACPMNIRRSAVFVNALLCERIETYFSSLSAAMLKGIFLGDKTDIPGDIKDIFRESGLSHVLAVSGLHLTMLVMLIGVLFKRLPRWLVNCIVVLTAVLFTFIVGLPVSAVRAAVMLILLTLANSFWLESDSLTNLSVIALIFLLKDANVIYDTSFVMSFLATLGIICIYPYFKNLLPVRLPETIKDSISITMAAQIGTLPYVIYSFGQFPLIAIISNLLICVILPLIFGLCIFALLFPMHPLIAAGQFCVLLLVRWAEFCANIPGQLLYIPFNVFILAGAFGFTVIALTGMAFKRKRVAACCMAGSIVVFSFGYVWAKCPPEHTELTFINVEQADCAMVRTEGGNTFLVDTGTAYMGGQEVIEYLLRNGIYSLSGIFISHFHDDHCGGVLEILETIDVAALYIPDTKDVGKNQYRILQAAQENNVPVYALSNGDTVCSSLI